VAAAAGQAAPKQGDVDPTGVDTMRGQRSGADSSRVLQMAGSA
jgi:molybdopterin-guanine dinucleotide biosynthesis protein